MKHRNEVWLREQIEVLGRTFDEVGKECRCTDENIKYFCRKWNIHSKNPKHARKGRFSGDKSPNWKGGTAPYNWNWNAISTALKVISNYTCSVCNIKPDNKQYICVHHIDEDKKNNHLSNLKVVCQGCHRKIHSKGGLI